MFSVWTVTIESAVVVLCAPAHITHSLTINKDNTIIIDSSTLAIDGDNDDDGDEEKKFCRGKYHLPNKLFPRMNIIFVYWTTFV